LILLFGNFKKEQSQKIAGFASAYRGWGTPVISQSHAINVGAAEGCDLLILLFGNFKKEQSQKIAGFASSYRGWGTPVISRSHAINAGAATSIGARQPTPTYATNV